MIWTFMTRDIANWKKKILTSYKFVYFVCRSLRNLQFFFQLAISLVIKVQIIHIISEMESWKVVLFGGFNNKNSRSYGCWNKAKTRVFRTFRLGLLKNLTCWSSSEAGFRFYGKNYFGMTPIFSRTNSKFFLQTCVIY